jgi:hypothetical protein
LYVQASQCLLDASGIDNRFAGRRELMDLSWSNDREVAPKYGGCGSAGQRSSQEPGKEHASSRSSNIKPLSHALNFREPKWSSHWLKPFGKDFTSEFPIRNPFSADYKTSETNSPTLKNTTILREKMFYIENLGVASSSRVLFMRFPHTSKICDRCMCVWMLSLRPSRCRSRGARHSIGWPTLDLSLFFP